LAGAQDLGWARARAPWARDGCLPAINAALPCARLKTAPAVTKTGLIRVFLKPEDLPP
jgi:hypothetical protein